MFNTVDYANLAAIVGRGTYNGIQEAAAAVSLYNKLQQAQNPPTEVAPVDVSNDSKNDTK